MVLLTGKGSCGLCRKLATVVRSVTWACSFISLTCSAVGTHSFLWGMQCLMTACTRCGCSDLALLKFCSPAWVDASPFPWSHGGSANKPVYEVRNCSQIKYVQHIIRNLLWLDTSINEKWEERGLEYDQWLCSSHYCSPLSHEEQMFLLPPRQSRRHNHYIRRKTSHPGPNQEKDIHL